MVKHIVAFKLKGSAEERLNIARQFKAALEALPSQIDVLQSIEVGINENTSEEWDIVLTAIVNTLEEVSIYAKHPAHVAAAGIIAPYKEARACVDYTC